MQGVSAMVMHLVRMAAAIVFIVACTFLPFLPGGYDGLAVTLSAMARLLGGAGLLLVPIGVLWSIYESTKRSVKQRNPSHQDKGYAFAIALVIASSIVWTVASFGTLAQMGPAAGFVALALGACGIWTIAPRLKRLKNAEAAAFNPTPLYLIVVPIGVWLLQWALAGPATEFSRNRAIANSAKFISDIEHYHSVHGHYPRSLASLWKDYKPSVIGIKEYHYAPSGEAYNVFFEQLTFRLGTREIVMFNKRDEHLLPSHDSDVLQWTPQELAARRGYYAVHDASSPHWKYFWFD